ncbi:MAG: TIGR00730 family Rossman fold protein [Clostridia bacterium]|nr:TIGR00730 family Rossman fold protein [Clostridia bacterium]
MKICIFGASSSAIDKSYIEKTEELGEALAKRGHSMIFGGGAKGLMGAAARGFHKEKGEIIGVSPSFFNVDGVLFQNCTEMIYTETMRERKKIMEESAEAFIILPGGMGTYDEFFETLTLKQLGRHSKPIAVFNINGFYNSLDNMMKTAVKENFMSEKNLGLYKIFSDIESLVFYLENYTPDISLIEEVKFLSDNNV